MQAVRGIYRLDLSAEDREYLEQRIEARRRRILWHMMALAIRNEADPVEKMARCAAAIGTFSRDPGFDVAGFTRACHRREG